MATLVLGAVGGAVAGPVGGAIGAALGQGLDARVLRPGRREGPRLSELRLQTSSYGTQIARVYGTMRVAGTVIWSTDLQETRVRGGGGKGQAATDGHAYAASFAVLLSARPAMGVGRIWADGQLLRGAAGDMKVAGTFRLHGGGEDQPPDPLLAAAEGTRCPAYRGCAYAVFEDLALGDYGNRIPQLTFELVADAGPVGVGAIAADLAGEVVREGLDEISGEIAGGVALALDGFAASGGSVRAVLETLAALSGGWFAPEGARLRMRDGGAATRTIADEGAAAGETGGVRAARRTAAADLAPRTLSVAHHDPQRDYQAGVQRATRPVPSGGAAWRDARIDVPAAISAASARALAEAALTRMEAARVRRDVTLGPGGLGVAPGEVVAIDGEPGAWRVAEATQAALVTRLALAPLTLASAAAPPASSGRVAAAVDLAVGQTVVHAFETPMPGDGIADAPRLGIAAAGGPGWRRAALFYSLDDGDSWTEAGGTAAPATIGALIAATGNADADAQLEDRTGIFVVQLAAGAVLADAADLDGGANLALIGDELVQFGRAAPMGGGRWRLSRLWRGRRGSPVGGQAAGDRFVLLDAETVRVLPLPLSAIGRDVRVMATGAGDGGTPAETTATVSGVSVAPPSPAGLTEVRAADGGRTVRWIRRSRAGWRWSDGADAPLVEEREAYRVGVTTATGTGTGTVRSVETAVPMLALSAAECADGPVTVTVVQLGTLAESPRATLMVRGGEDA